jgi:hypothetical protein
MSFRMRVTLCQMAELQTKLTLGWSPRCDRLARIIHESLPAFALPQVEDLRLTSTKPLRGSTTDRSPGGTSYRLAPGFNLEFWRLREYSGLKHSELRCPLGCDSNPSDRFDR